MSHEAGIKRGMVLRHQGQPHLVLEVLEHKSGKQKATVHLTLRNLRTGKAVDRTLDDLGEVEPVEHTMRTAQYLYDEGDGKVFMDGETFEQNKLDEQQTGSAGPFLVMGSEYKVLYVDDKPVILQLPDVVALEVTDTAPPSKHGGTGSNVMKEATLASGLVVRVPLFIKIGDVVRIETASHHYVGKHSS